MYKGHIELRKKKFDPNRDKLDLHDSILMVQAQKAPT
jgi:hypothetical protein